jgi:cell division protein FtsL
MTAPARSRRAAGKTGTVEPTHREATETQRGLDAPAKPTRTGSAGRRRSAAAERAYARRAQRTGRRAPGKGQEQRSEQHIASRVSFVMLVIGLLTVGVVATLWLSTQAIQDSYRLDRAKRAATELAERAQLLQREVAYLESASRLAEEAAKAGMVESGDPAHLVVGPDGKTTVVGQPTPAKPATPPQQQQQPPVPQPGQLAAGQGTG